MNSQKLYSLLEKIPNQMSYSAKLLGVAGIGLALQGLTFGIWATSNARMPLGPVVTLSAVFLVATLIVLRHLLQPLDQVTKFMASYVEKGEITDLPDHNQDDMGLLMRNARNTVVKLDRSMKEIQVASQIDVLTGISNRSASLERLHQDLARSDRTLMPISMIVADIDEFKKINDAYGPSVGDACLQHFVKVAADSIREGDWVGRWGGDEFIIVLWGADTEIAESVIWRLKRNLASSEDAHEAGIKLTASYGFTTHLPGQLDYEFVSKADLAVLNAKKQGRNRVCSEPMLR